MLKDNSKFDSYYIAPTIEGAKRTAPYLSKINPIVLTLSQGQSLNVATTMTANKVYLGLDNNGKPEYKENVEFNKQ